MRCRTALPATLGPGILCTVRQTRPCCEPPTSAAHEQADHSANRHAPRSKRPILTRQDPARQRPSLTCSRRPARRSPAGTTARRTTRPWRWWRCRWSCWQGSPWSRRSGRSGRRRRLRVRFNRCQAGGTASLATTHVSRSESGPRHRVSHVRRHGRPQSGHLCSLLMPTPVPSNSGDAWRLIRNQPDPHTTAATSGQAYARRTRGAHCTTTQRPHLRRAR